MNDKLRDPVSNHPNRGGGRFNKAGANPTPNQVRELLEESGMTQPEFAALVYKGVRTVEDWLSGERRMPPDTFELLRVKITGMKLLKKGEIAPADIRRLGLVMPDEKPVAER